MGLFGVFRWCTLITSYMALYPYAMYDVLEVYHPYIAQCRPLIKWLLLTLTTLLLCMSLMNSAAQCLSCALISSTALSSHEVMSHKADIILVLLLPSVCQVVAGECDTLEPYRMNRN